MKGDFSRDAFGVRRHDYRVLMQQGRVQLDADWNEQNAIVLHRLETLVHDAFGAHAGPEGYCGFALFDDGDEGSFGIGAGRYYVHGRLVENERPRSYAAHAGGALDAGHAYVIYLDTWEEFVAPQQDPELLDPALEGLDTTARSRIVWRVRAQRVVALPSQDEIADGWPFAFLDAAQTGPPGRLAAAAGAGRVDADGTAHASAIGYRGSENRLYRVEIHDPGTAVDGATFKWSRDNGAVAYAIHGLAEKVVTLATAVHDASAALGPGDWVEICDDDDAGARRPARGLFPVAHADATARTVTLTSAPVYAVERAKHPVLRRWDQRSTPLSVVESFPDDDGWIALEEGLTIRFASAASGAEPSIYRTGDYWMIPARTTGALLWPHDEHDRPALREPAGIRHAFAPLAGIHIAASGTFAFDRQRHDYRRSFRSLSHRP